MATMSRRLAAEFLGTALLVATVVGSGIMGTALSSDQGIALLINALATVAALGVLIWILGPISGAHFNPLVSGASMALREMPVREGAPYIVVQVAGACVGAMLGNLMFELPAVDISTQARDGWQLGLGEVVAAAGLLFVIGALTRTSRGHLGPILVPAWIGAAYFFTSSTSFANPAVTVGRSLSDTFSGIAPASVPAFIGFQILGAAVGVGLTAFFYSRRKYGKEPLDLPDPVQGA
jgi:glycerol uptake facilitator-like aquaporin